MLDPATWEPAETGEGAPLLLVVVDTEEEFPWSEPHSRDNISVDTIAAQARAHRLFEKYGIRPTYVMDFPVASQEAGYRPLRELHQDGACGLGAHVHPWVNPPFEETVNNRNSFPGNLPPALEKAKLEILAGTIEQQFGTRPTIYKAGRYGVGPNTADILNDLGFEIDMSVVPMTDFRADDGPDFRHCGAAPYWFGPGRILEIPVTAGFTGAMARAGWTGWSRIDTPAGRLLKLTAISDRIGLLTRIVLTPEGITIDEQKRLTRRMLSLGHRVFSFTYHSPSLTPGCTPYVSSERDLDRFLDCMDRYFDYFLNEIGGRPSTPEEILALARAAPPVSRQAS